MPPKADQKLPANDYPTFQKIVAHYEKREYPKAIKKADQLLAKFPNHGETLAMKGLVILNMDVSRKEEAKKLIKAGVAANMFSHVVWHVYGMLYRADRLYEDAMKCYQRALVNDPGNAQILKDLATLQIQRRNMTGYAETRRQLLMQKSNNRGNWLAYAIGTHLSGQHGKALGIMDSYVATETDFNKRKANYEDSEILLYRNLIIEEGGNIQQALDHLNSIEKQVVDRMGWREKKALLSLKLSKFSEAEKEYRTLLAVNIENMAYHLALRCALQLEPENSPAHVISASSSSSASMSCATVVYSEEQRTKLSELYEQFSAQFPKAATVKRMPLDFEQGPAFVERVDAYLKNGIRKGIPSLFRDLSPLYNDKNKAKILGEMVLDFAKHLQESSKFDDKQDAPEAPSALLWTWYYLGQHFDHLGQYGEALKYAEQGLQHTPTAIDFLVLKARIYKHSGDYKQAHIVLDAGRQMDLADRYLNVKCTRYAMQVGDFDKGLETVALFLKDQDGPLSSLFDMQVSWFANSAGDLYYRKQQWGPALRYYHNTHSFFETMIEDQFDFHGYCLRKLTLRAYIQMLRFEDDIMTHRFYRHAAKQLVRVYMTLAQARSTMSDEEKKKETEDIEARIVKRKEEREKEKAHKKKDKEKEGEKEAEKKDAIEDVDGNLLLETTDPLGEAAKYLKNLELYCPADVEAHLLAAQFYTLKKQPKEVAKALKAAIALDNNHPDVHVALSSFLQTADDSVKDETKEEALGGGKSVKDINDAFVAKNATSLAHRLAAARVLVSLDASASSAAASLVVIKDDDQQPTTEVLLAAHEFLQSLHQQEALASFVSKAHALSPLTPAFIPAAQA